MQKEVPISTAKRYKNNKFTGSFVRVIVIIFLSHTLAQLLELQQENIQLWHLEGAFEEGGSHGDIDGITEHLL